MLTLLHLSDLHFATADAGTQFDRDVEIRTALVRDLGLEGRTNFDALLVTGDIAYHGKTKEFERANQWFDEVRNSVGLPAESLFVIPGNHDVNREHVGDKSVVLDSHTKIRGITDSRTRDADVEAKLKDTSFDFLRSLSEYRNFAATHDCPTSATALAWNLQLTKPLDDGTPVRLHGLNSALLSDKLDEKANLLVTPFQFNHLAASSGCVEIVMCHHPCTWLMDGNDVEDCYRRYASLIMTGHEHQSRCFRQGNSLQVCAGAVHPSRGEASWQPSYNVIRLSIESTPEKRALVIEVETRNWHKTDRTFVAAPWSGFPSGRFTHRQDLTLVRIAQSQKIHDNNVATPAAPELLPVPEQQPIPNDVAFASGRRKLIVHFFRLGIIPRYEIVRLVGIYEESDEALEGQARWARMFERAEQNQKLPALWTAIANRDDSLVGVPNPFTLGT